MSSAIAVAAGRATCDPGHPVAVRAEQRQRAENQRDQCRENEGEMAKFGDHVSNLSSSCRRRGWRFAGRASRRRVLVRH